MAKIGPFFYIGGRLIFHAIKADSGRRQAGKLDDPCGHDALFDAHFTSEDYIDFPRGRVVWDTEKGRAIVYIDRCIETPEVLGKIVSAFDLSEYVVEHDDHYRCPGCIGDLFDEI